MFKTLRMKILLSFAFCSLILCQAGALAAETPKVKCQDNLSSRVLDLSGWKLQVPGPKEFKDLKKYVSYSHYSMPNYFYLMPNHTLCFELDASEKGHTKHSEFVRSELRHLLNWPVSQKHGLSASIKMQCNIEPYQVTVAQIHGITSAGENAPPLLRIAIVDGNIYAFVKQNNAGTKTEKIFLSPYLAAKFFQIQISVDNRTLVIKLNGQEKVRRNLSFWKYDNYFKIGCYPQVKQGKFKIEAKELTVY